jgi:glucose-6-phosphate 1-dehydrogenase
VDNWRWAGVPFYVRTGKRLPKRVSEIAIQFNSAPLHLFNQDSGDAGVNLLILRIQPEEGISLKFLSKRPGSGMTLRPVSMDFNYGSSFGERSPSAYETLLLDAIVGDPTLYNSPRHGGGELESWWSRSRIRGAKRTSDFPTTRREVGARPPPTRCWRGAVHTWRKP